MPPALAQAHEVSLGIRMSELPEIEYGFFL